MTREEAIHILDNLKPTNTKSSFDAYVVGKAITMAIKALKQEPCGDAISRQAVKDWFCTNYCSEHNECEHFEKGDCNAMIELFAIPPVNPQEPKTGHWIKDDITERSKSAYKHKCDRCGAYHRAMYDYCPSCGARMAESEDKE